MTDSTPFRAERPPPFWEERAKRLTGKTVLVGKTIIDDQREVERIQFFGTIESASDKGIAIRGPTTASMSGFPPT